MKLRIYVTHKTGSSLIPIVTFIIKHMSKKQVGYCELTATLTFVHLMRLHTNRGAFKMRGYP